MPTYAFIVTIEMTEPLSDALQQEMADNIAEACADQNVNPSSFTTRVDGVIVEVAK